jgi:prepilin signal peptidase PulO-like enzyme (type II secretory pathway)
MFKSNPGLSKDLPVVMLAFILAFSLPHSVNPSNFSEHLTGIALGFGFAWLLKMLIDWKNKKSNSSKKEVSNES